MKSYGEFVGGLIDKGKTNTQIAEAILKAEEAGKIIIPFKVWAVCDRFRILNNSGSKDLKTALGDQFNANPPVMFFDEPKWVRQFRQILQSEDRSFTTLEKRSPLQRKLLENFPQIDAWFGSGKRQHLRDLRIIDRQIHVVRGRLPAHDPSTKKGTTQKVPAPGRDFSPLDKWHGGYGR